MEVSSLWLWLWVRTFKQSAQYFTYCQAVANNDQLAQLNLENFYPALSELFLDFGDVFAVETDNESISIKLERDTWVANRSFKEFCRRMSPLIYTNTGTTKLIHDVDTYTYAPGNLLLNVVLHKDRHKTLKDIEHYIDFMYQFRDEQDYDYSGFKTELEGQRLKKMVEPLPTAKYRLYGNVNEATLGAVEKALYVGELNQLLKDGKPLSQSDTVIHILLDESSPMGDNWKMPQEDRLAYEKGVLKKSEIYESKRKQIRFYRDQCDRLVANAIHGRFPDFT